MLLRLAALPTDWHRVVTRLEQAGSPALAGIVRTLLPIPVATTFAETAEVPMAFTPRQAGAVQSAAAGIGLSLHATPIADRFDPAPGASAHVGRLATQTSAVRAGHEETR